MKKVNIGVMGATGAVGQEMIKVLGERNFPVGELSCLASARSEGKVLSTPFGDVSESRAHVRLLLTDLISCWALPRMISQWQWLLTSRQQAQYSWTTHPHSEWILRFHW